jgi:hypothetical protein
MACCSHVERSLLSNTKAHDPWMNQPRESALPEKPLESVVSPPVPVARATKKLKFQHQALRPLANNKVEAMKPVQPNGRPGLACFPTIRTAMHFGIRDKPRAVDAIRYTSRRVFPRMRVYTQVGRLLVHTVDDRKDEPSFQIALVHEPGRNRICKQALHETGLKRFDRVHICLANTLCRRCSSAYPFIDGDVKSSRSRARASRNTAPTPMTFRRVSDRRHWPPTSVQTERRHLLVPEQARFLRGVH